MNVLMTERTDDDPVVEKVSPEVAEADPATDAVNPPDAAEDQAAPLEAEDPAARGGTRRVAAD